MTVSALPNPGRHDNIAQHTKSHDGHGAAGNTYNRPRAVASIADFLQRRMK